MSESQADEIGWVEAPKNYSVGLRDGKLVCRNPKGRILATVPKWLKQEEVSDRLLALASWLAEHQLECRHTVERWMLRSLLIPREIVVEVWPDPDWRSALENLVIAPVDGRGKIDHAREGLLRDVDAEKGVGIVDLDGETKWLKSPLIAFPHPILIEDLSDLRELAGDLGVKQVVNQLYRPVHQATSEQQELAVLQDFSNGRFEQLSHVTSLCRRLGYPVRGGYATCRVWENGTVREARYYIGEDSPDYEAYTGELIFVNDEQQPVPIGEVGEVTFSEGVLMASSIYANRQVDEREADD